MTSKKKKLFILIPILIVLTYVLVTLIITLSSVLGMVVQNKKSRGVELGTAAYASALERGGNCYQLYSDDEIAQNKTLAVSKLYYLPSTSGNRTDFVIIVPGGGYFECDVNKVALPCASKVLDKGYTAFVLAYRYGKYSKDKYAPMQDIARAVQYIIDNSDSFNVNAEDYAVIGYSAGGNLAGLYASKELGYAKYGLPKPKAIMLAYPWTNINDNPRITGNMWQDLITAVGKSRANKIVLGKGVTKTDKLSLCAQNYVDSDYPATYIITGDKDVIVNYKRNSVIMDNALASAGVRHQLVIAKGLNHGFGLGIGTTADGWVDSAIEFWQA